MRWNVLSPQRGVSVWQLNRLYCLTLLASHSTVGPDQLTLPLFVAEEYEFNSFGNWVIPGKLMVGRYPGNEQRSDDVFAHGGDKYMIDLLTKARATAWVSLQDETPPQILATPTSSLLTTDGMPKDWTETTFEPTNNDKVWRDDKYGNFTAYAPFVTDLSDNILGREPKFVHFPMKDLSSPSLEGLERMVGTIQDLIDSDEVVYLHCHGGKGRSGTVGAAVLAALYPSETKDRILQRLRDAFDTRNVSGSTPETPEQLQVLHRFMNKWLDATQTI